MEILTGYIYADFDGLVETMGKLLDCESIVVDPKTFENRLDKVDSRDKALTVLIHLGFLAYDYYSGDGQDHQL